MYVIYTAGPYRARHHSKIKQNIAHAKTMALEVCRAGAYSMCPHLNTAHFDDDGIPDELVLGGGLSMVHRCDAVLMFGDWELSEGALSERDHARECGKPVFYSLDEMRQWLAGQSVNLESDVSTDKHAMSEVGH